MTDNLDNTNRLEDEDLDQVSGGQNTPQQWMHLIPVECPKVSSGICRNRSFINHHEPKLVTYGYIVIKCKGCKSKFRIDNQGNIKEVP